MTTQTKTKKTIPAKWHGKPYYSLDAWCKNTLGRKCYKIALNAHMTCPNRDGSLDTRGCIFCSAGGSGDFAVNIAGKSVEEQLAEGLALFHAKYCTPSEDIAAAIFSSGTNPGPTRFPNLIAYFQAYTNTYAPLPYLRSVYTKALDCPVVCGISIATRPDCLHDDVLALLSELKTAYPDKFIWVELGLQTIHEKSAQFIRRGYDLPCFEKAFAALQKIKVPVIVHLILGLPDETPDMILESISYLNRLQTFGVKLQLLHILRGTDLGELYLHQNLQTQLAGTSSSPAYTPVIRPLAKDEYLALLTDCIRHLSPDIVIHRLTGDGPKALLLAPEWSENKRDVLNSLHQKLKLLSATQGDALPQA
ncbi:MAG: TIGR01212 family radical SAM protein [Lachnospiraceae bacterium]|nr:TIGR01212 family radical SAM protein [Lachnospiraceae bacterium]